MSEINVLYPFDNNYAPYAGISITSLLENNKSAEIIRVFILGFSLTTETEAKLRRTVERYGRDITFIEAEPVEDFIQGLNMPSYRGASIAVARLFVSKFMLYGIKRLLYLDSDTVVVGSIASLIDSDLKGNAVGMVCDSVGRDYKKLHGFRTDEEYYNGGMIVYDLPSWREKRCSERIEEHILKVRNQYEALDQDLINIVLKGEITRLDLRYNLQPFHLVYSSKTYLRVYGSKGYYSAKEIESATASPVILHTFRYLGMFPWHKDTLHPCLDSFEEYKRLSEWKEIDPVEIYSDHFMIRVERMIKKALPQGMFLWVFRTIFRIRMGIIEKKMHKGKTYVNM